MTNDSVMKYERSSLVRGSDLPKCHSALTRQSVVCGVGLAARTGKEEVSEAGKHTSSKRRYEYTARHQMKKCCISWKRHMKLPKPSYSDNVYQ